MDSDDFITRHYIDVLLKIALEQNCDIVQCKLRWGCSPDSIDDFKRDRPFYMTVHKSREEAEWSLQSGSDARLGGMVCGKIYRKKLFDNIEFPIGKIHEDEAVMHRLIYAADRIACISAVMYYQQDSKSSIMRDEFSAKRYDALDQLEDRYQFFLEKGLVDCAYVTAQRIGGQIIELYRMEKEHTGRSNKELLIKYAETLPRYINSPYMTPEVKQLHLMWLTKPDAGEWYFVIDYMRQHFSTISDWETEVNL